jgi:hypothetical protein
LQALAAAPDLTPFKETRSNGALLDLLNHYDKNRGSASLSITSLMAAAAANGLWLMLPQLHGLLPSKGPNAVKALMAVFWGCMVDAESRLSTRFLEQWKAFVKVVHETGEHACVTFGMRCVTITVSDVF